MAVTGLSRTHTVVDKVSVEKGRAKMELLEWKTVMTHTMFGVDYVTNDT